MRPSWLVLVVLSGCGSGPSAGSADAGSADDATDDGAPPVLPAGDSSTPDAPVAPSCVVPPDGMDGVVTVCNQKAPPMAFSPKIKWAWAAPYVGGDWGGSAVLPLVGNFTDDNGDGKIDLCDVPDVILTLNGYWPGQLVMLSGDKGKLEVTFDGQVNGTVAPAFADIDGDLLPEVVTLDRTNHVVAYEHTGKLKWTSAQAIMPMNDNNQGPGTGCYTVSIYDLDADGSPELIVGYDVFDHAGNHLFSHPHTPTLGDPMCPTTTAADLDGDGKLEVIFGDAAYHADGSAYFDVGGLIGHPQVANVDADPEPEIIFVSNQGVTVRENDGTLKFAALQNANMQGFAAAIDDFNGNGVPDIALVMPLRVGVYEVQTSGLALDWASSTSSTGGDGTVGGYDFLGRGIPQVAFGDLKNLYLADGKTGATEPGFPQSRLGQNGRAIDYPVVADVDNDGSADLLVVSFGEASWGYVNAIEVFEDAEKRWIPTRRIWNQHAYHVTNVREDGTIPKKMNKSWLGLNTFRVNSQIDATNGSCVPPPPK